MSTTSLKTAVSGPIYCYKTVEKDKIVRYFYQAEDTGWHTMVHKMGGTVDQNIISTLNSISESSEMFVVNCGDKVAGFFVRHTELFPCLEGFHIKKEFRNAWFIEKFWKIVRQVFGCSFTTGICSKNKPAIDHLLRQGFLAVDKKYFDDHTFIILKLNQ